MERHFFLLPPCAVVATTVAFQKKGNFSWPFLGFHIYFKIPIASLARKFYSDFNIVILLCLSCCLLLV